jgi:hypothetical protein
LLSDRGLVGAGERHVVSDDAPAEVGPEAFAAVFDGLVGDVGAHGPEDPGPEDYAVAFDVDHGPARVEHVPGDRVVSVAGKG